MNLRLTLLLIASTVSAAQTETPAKTPNQTQTDSVDRTSAPSQKDDKSDAASDSCPISIVKIDPTGNDSFGHAFLAGSQGRSARQTDGTFFVLKVKNTSGKAIRGMKFQAAYYDATEDLHDIPIAWQWTDPVPASAEKTFRWENLLYRDRSLLGWKVRLLKVLYEDGTKWEPAKEDSCSGEFWRNKKRKKVSSEN